MTDLEALKIHGFVFDYSSSDSGKSEFDEEHDKLKPPPICINNGKYKIIEVKANTDQYIYKPNIKEKYVARKSLPKKKFKPASKRFNQNLRSNKPAISDKQLKNDNLQQAAAKQKVSTFAHAKHCNKQWPSNKTINNINSYAKSNSRQSVEPTTSKLTSKQNSTQSNLNQTHNDKPSNVELKCVKDQQLDYGACSSLTPASTSYNANYSTYKNLTISNEIIDAVGQQPILEEKELKTNSDRAELGHGDEEVEIENCCLNVLSMCFCCC